MERKPYTVSQDPKTGLYYAHKEGYTGVPVAGSFGTRWEATQYARMKNGLPHQVERIEQRRKEVFEAFQRE